MTICCAKTCTLWGLSLGLAICHPSSSSAEEVSDQAETPPESRAQFDESAQS